MGDIIPINGHTKDERRQQIAALQAGMLDMPQVECPLVHHFANGVYGREIHLPADTVLVGEIHRHDCIVVLSRGRLRVITDISDREIVAPATFTIPAGVKNVGVTYEPCIWTTFHPNPTEEHDPEVLRAALTAPSYNDIELLAQSVQTIEVDK